MEPTPSNASAKIVSALIIGLLVGFAAGAFWQERRSRSLLDDVSSTQARETGGKAQTAGAAGGLLDAVRTEKTGGMKAATEKSAMSVTMETAAVELQVADQPAGANVQVARVSTKEIIWVAVREEKDGKVGNILGAQKVFVGDGQKVTVDLLRPTTAGGAYRVVVYRDTGSPAFNYREDALIEGVEGRFTAK